MIVGIGTDIVEIARIEKAFKKFGVRFSQRILCEQEQLIFKQRNNAIEYLANRFAAKEALAKAFGTGIGESVRFQDINIANDKLGKPTVSFKGETKKTAETLAVSKTFLSIADERHYVVAMVVLES